MTWAPCGPPTTPRRWFRGVAVAGRRARCGRAGRETRPWRPRAGRIRGFRYAPRRSPPSPCSPLPATRCSAAWRSRRISSTRRAFPPCAWRRARSLWRSSWRRREGRPGLAARPDWRTVATLFGYVALFSFAYLSLGAGTGALILFGAVQLTMFAVALRRGEHFARLSWVGLAVAIAGLVYSCRPGLPRRIPPGRR